MLHSTHPFDLHGIVVVQPVQFPEVMFVLHWFSIGQFPSFLFPSSNPHGDGVDDEMRVRVDAKALQSLLFGQLDCLYGCLNLS